MESVGERYLAAADHYNGSKTHTESQSNAFVQVDSAYQAFTKHAGNTLLEGSPSRRKALQRAAEDALSAYEKFM